MFIEQVFERIDLVAQRLLLVVHAGVGDHRRFVLRFQFTEKALKTNTRFARQRQTSAARTRKSRCSIERRSTSPLRNFCSSNEFVPGPMALFTVPSMLIKRD